VVTSAHSSHCDTERHLRCLAIDRAAVWLQQSLSTVWLHGHRLDLTKKYGREVKGMGSEGMYQCGESVYDNEGGMSRRLCVQGAQSISATEPVKLRSMSRRGHVTRRWPPSWKLSTVLPARLLLLTLTSCLVPLLSWAQLSTSADQGRWQPTALRPGSPGMQLAREYAWGGLRETMNVPTATCPRLLHQLERQS
jgi:hypothetical protein